MSQKITYQLSIRQILLIALISAFIAAGTMACIGYFGNRFQPLSSAETNSNNAASDAKPLAGINDPATVSDEQNNIEVYRSLAPGVAFITSTSYQKDDWGDVEPSEGSGSGSVIDAEGRILTNHHVVEGAQKLTVSLGGDKVYPAKLVGSDPDTDLAVIKIDAPKEALTLVPFGDSDKLIVGQKVLAIGNPFGLDRTLTTGVISGLQRPIRSRPLPGAPEGRVIEGAIQTDASINPGNSGGPLLDKFGRLIGINSQILSRSGGSVGIGFAIPVSIAKRVVPQLIEFGEVRRPKLGVNIVSISQLREQGVRLPVEDGVLVRNLQPGGSAERAGLRGLSQDARGEVVLGDIILTIDGQKITNQDELFRALDKRQIGDTAQVEIIRDGKKMMIPVKLLASPAATQRAPVRRF